MKRFKFDKPDRGGKSMAKAKNKAQTQLDKKEELEKKCPTCGSENVVRDYVQNIEICEKCGRVIKEDIKDRGPEWRAFDQEQKENRSRAGPPSTETIHDKGLSTKISWKNRDSRGNNLSPQRKSTIQRLRKWQKRSRISGAKDRNLATALSEIDRMSSQLGLPKSVREEAATIYRTAVNEDLIRGRSIEGISTAALYIACRQKQFPRTLKEIAEVSRVEKKEISRSYRFVCRELDIQIPPVDPTRFVARFGSDLNVSGQVRTKAIELIRKAKEEGLTSGKSPTGTAAGAIYIASLMNDKRRTQKEVAKSTGTTEVTVRNRYKEMVDELGLDLEV